MRRRARVVVAAMVATGAVLLSACSGSTDQSAVTVTSNVTAGPNGSSAPGSAGPGRSATPGSSVAGSTSSPARPGSSTAPAGSSTAPAGASTAAGSSANPSTPLKPGAQPDGFVPTKLAPGQKAPQFVIISFDGAGWHDKWTYWRGIQAKVPLHFTAFLSGTYMLSSATKLKYTGPGHSAGKSSIGWNDPAELPVQIADLNEAISRGDEIGTHANGHFCAGAGSSGNDWDQSDWNNELDQFFSLVKNVDANNGITQKLNLPASEVKGIRTPCLEGKKEALFPALKAHGLTYDSSFTRRGISWPTQSSDNKIWQFGMAEFPINGRLPDGSPVDPSKRDQHYQITMDYNFYFSQRGASSKGVSPEQSKADSLQVLNTYRDMYRATSTGNRAPLILGNHFNEWNNNAYSDAIANFALETCGKPDTLCLPFRDVIAWMNVQDPARLAQLQAQAPALTPGT